MLQRVLRVSRLSGAVLLLSLHGLAQPADQATRDAARTLGTAGVEAYQAGNFENASDKLEKAYQLLKVPSLGLWSARALAKRSLLVDAASRYLEVVSLQIPHGDAGVQRQAQADAQTELDALRPKIPRLVVRVTGADAADVSLSIDGRALSSSVIGSPRLMDPGRHEVQVESGNDRKSAVVSLAIGKEAIVELSFSSAEPGAPAGSGEAAADGGPAQEPAPADAGAASGSPRRTAGWVVLGAGGVGLVVGGVTGVLALGKRSKLEDSGACVEDRCPPSKQDEVDSLQTFRTVSSVGLIAGGALAATGLVLLLTAPSNETQLSASVGFGSIRLRGTF